MISKRLDFNFWSQFGKNVWEKKTLVLRGLDSPVLEIDASQIFSLLVRYSDICRKTKCSDGLKLYIDGQRQYSDEVLDLLPVRSDRTLQGYNQRMGEIFADYCLVCDELLQLDLDKWKALSAFTQSLYQQVGLPNRFSEVGLYLGNYKKTPFGVHVDNCGVFSFPVVGNKRFRIWTDSFVKKHPELIRSQSYQKFKKNSELIIASPGDMTYWPSSAWHIAESDGSFSATWSVGVWVDQPYIATAVAALTPLLADKLKKKQYSVTTPFATPAISSAASVSAAVSLPALHRQSIAILKQLSSQQLHDAFLRSWTIHASKHGFKTVPKKPTIDRLRLDSRIQLQSNLPILWSYLASDAQYIFAFGGTAVEQKTSTGFLKLIQELNATNSCHIAKFLKGGSAKRELTYLQSLAAAGAISLAKI